MHNTAHIIVIGNEKGGAGKTTSAMHVIANLMSIGFKVGSIDLDCRQQSLTRYLENRKLTALKRDIALPMPDHYVGKASELKDLNLAEEEETQAFNAQLAQASANNDFIVIDTPGSNSFLSRLAHSYADTIITPINDSFVDLDLLARVEADNLNIEKPSIYSQMVWEQKMNRAKRDRGVIDWVVMRNRLSYVDAKNKRNIYDVLQKLSQRIGFRLVSGFGERVVFRELFLHGLTLLDISYLDGFNFTMSHVAARQELRDFLKQLNIKKLNSVLVEETV
jgi:chromosome partitioning protein